jgi:peptide/nickel transport system substrate-binding protein
LTEPTGDLGYRFSLGFASPLPALPNDPSALFGVATGHDDGDSGFLVSSGPYMLKGSEALDFSLPPATQKPAAGFALGRSITLVRNPSWSGATDTLRPAYADRIVITFARGTTEAAAALQRNTADVVLSVLPAPQAPLDQIRTFVSNPSLGRVEVDSHDVIRYVSMNLATPPFDDVHVRRAVAFAVDRAGVPAEYGGPVTGTLTGHLALDSMEGNALLNFDPYRTADAHGRLEMAKAEMAQSHYDPGHTGVCSAAVCQGLVAMVIADANHPASLGAVVAADLARIGIRLEMRDEPPVAFFTTVGDPTQRVPMAIGWGWGKAYPNGSDFFTNLFSSRGIAGGVDYSLLGATPDQLREWGYTAPAVPNVDDRINQCLPLIGAAQSRCWADVDEYIMDAVVPAVPLFAENYIEVLPARITAYSFDEAFNMPALDRIAVGGAP